MSLYLKNAVGGCAMAGISAAVSSREINARHSDKPTLIAGAQLAQLYCLKTLFSRLVILCPGTGQNILSRSITVLYYTGLAYTIVQAANRTVQNDSNGLASVQNNPSHSSKVAKFILAHAGILFRVAVIVMAVAMGVLGNPCYGAAFTLHTFYLLADERKWVPEKISQFTRRYFNLLILALMIPYSGWLMRIGAIVILSNRLSPSTLTVCYLRIDGLVRKLFSMDGHSAADYRQPLVQNELSYGELHAFLTTLSQMNAFERKWAIQRVYQINPAHCSSIPPPSSLEQNRGEEWRRYERSMREALQNAREITSQASYAVLVQMLSAQGEGVSNDLHEIFVPKEQEPFTLHSLWLSLVMNPGSVQAYREYCSEIGFTVREAIRNDAFYYGDGLLERSYNFLDYIHETLRSNPNLSQDQQDELIRLIENEKNSVHMQETLSLYMLIKMGILRKK